MLNDISSFLERYGEIPDDDEFTSKSKWNHSC